VKTPPQTRRQFVKKTAGALAAGWTAPYIFTADAEEATLPRDKNDRLRIGAIGMRYQGTVITDEAARHGDVVAICDVDREIAEKTKEHYGGKADLYGDYRKMLQRKDIDLVTIGTPDHWHTAIAIAACQAGKDVYCEKPLTLTIDEGKLLCKVVEQTGAVFQVGTWQRSDHRFRLGCELVRQGRIGKLKKVTVVLDKNKTGGPFPVVDPPPHLDWDTWQGQTPATAYIAERCHYTFRWWYEYSGGQMTDWGAHHIDIAQWGMGVDRSGPVEIEGKATFPQVPNGYNVATSFAVRMVYPDGVELEVADEGRNGVMFEGEKGRIFVNRGTVSGAPVEQFNEDPIAREDLFKMYGHDNFARPARMGKHDSIINHMGNLIDCMKTRNTPISSVVSQHRSVSTCHLANISMRLGRKLTWNPRTEQFVGDDEANRWLSRPRRKPYDFEG